MSGSEGSGRTVPFVHISCSTRSIPVLTFSRTEGIGFPSTGISAGDIHSVFSAFTSEGVVLSHLQCLSGCLEVGSSRSGVGQYGFSISSSDTDDPCIEDFIIQSILVGVVGLSGGQESGSGGGQR